MHMRHLITAAFLCVCLTAVAGCKKASEPVEQSQAVKQTISMEQPAPAGGQQPPAAGTGQAAPDKGLPPAAEQPAKTAGVEGQAAVQPTGAAPAPAEPKPEVAAEPAADAQTVAQEDAMEAGDAADEAVGSEEATAGGEATADAEVVLDLAGLESDASAEDDAAKKDEEELFSPFTPLFQKEEKNDMVVESDSQQRAFLTPLERISLGQLQLSGIIRATSGNRAIVTDATGKGYVIKKGTYIGLNSGKVEEIVDDRVVVVETIGGRRSVTELKLQKPAGE